jgi:hypothetical protein
LFDRLRLDHFILDKKFVWIKSIHIKSSKHGIATKVELTKYISSTLKNALKQKECV